MVDEPNETPAPTPDPVVAGRLEAAERRIAETQAELAREREERARQEREAAREREREALKSEDGRLAKIREYAASGQDALAPDYLETRERLAKLEREREEEKREAAEERDRIEALNADLRKIENEEERKAARDYFAANVAKRPGLDIQGALDAVRAKKVADEAETLRQALAAANQKPREGIQTHHRDVTAATAKAREVSRADFRREQADLEESGQVDARMRAQIALRQGIRKNTIRVKD